MYVQQRLSPPAERLGERRTRGEKSYCKSTSGQKFGDNVSLGYITHFTSTDHGEGNFKESSFVHEHLLFQLLAFSRALIFMSIVFLGLSVVVTLSLLPGTIQIQDFSVFMLESTLPSMPPTSHLTRLNIDVLVNANCEMSKY